MGKISIPTHKFQIKVESSMEENKGGVSHFVAFANFTLIKKSIFWQKEEELGKTQIIFHHVKII